MKLSIILAIALIATVQSAPSCSSSKYCMGCHATVSDQCTSCYNGSDTTIGARYLSANACENKVTVVTDCTIYHYGLTEATVPNSGLQVGCVKCGSSKFPLIETGATGQPTLASTGTVSCDTKWQTPEANISDTTVANCDRPAYIVDNAALNITRCMLCQDQKHASTNGTQCENDATDMIANCSQEVNTGTTDASIRCYVPKTGFALTTTDGTAASAFTDDANCRVAASSHCIECKDTYWFSGSTCVSSAKMMILSFATLLAAWMF